MKRKMPKKVLLALVAALVLAVGSAIAVFASESVTGLGWWMGAASTAQEVNGEGSWYYTIDVTADENGEAYFNVEMYDATTVTDGESTWTEPNYFTTGVLGDAWGAVALSTYEVDSYGTMAAGASYIVQIVRDDSLITVTYYEIVDDVAVLRYTFAMDATVFTDTAYWHVLAQVGTIDVEFYEGTADLGTVMTTANKITSIDVVSLSQDTFKQLDKLNLEGTVVAVTYDNGLTVNVTLDDANDSDYTMDPFGFHYIRYSISGDWGWYYAGNLLYDEGDYTLHFYAYDYDWNMVLSESDGTTDTVITVREVTTEDAEENATEMELDGVYTVTEDEQWFKFTPETSGYYVFSTTENSSAVNSLVDMYEEIEGELYEWYWDYADDGSLVYRAYLEEGQTYYFRTVFYYGSVSMYGEYDVTITESKTIKSLEVTTLGNVEFTQYVDQLHIGGTVVTLTYEDNTTEQVTFGESAYSAVDSSGNYIYFYVETEEGEENLYDGSYVYLDPGTYTLVVYHGDIEDATQSITVISTDDSDAVTTIELLDTEYSAETTNGEIAYFVFTPAADGQYYFVYSGDDSYAYEDNYMNWPYCFKTYTYDDGVTSYSYVGRDTADYAYDEDGNQIYYETEDGSYRVFELTGGCTYVIGLYCYRYTEDWEFDSEATVTVSMLVGEVNHAHTYNDVNITWTWAEDYTSATAVLRCDTCPHTETGTATITSVTTDATATTAGSIVYTATVTIGGVEYTNTVTVEIPATGETGSTSGEGTNSTGSTGTGSTGTSSTGSTSPKTGDVSTVGYYVVLLFAAAAIAVLAKKRANA